MGYYPSANGLTVFASFNWTRYLTVKGYHYSCAAVKIQRWYRKLKQFKQPKPIDWNEVEKYIWGGITGYSESDTDSYTDTISHSSFGSFELPPDHDDGSDSAWDSTDDLWYSSDLSLAPKCFSQK